VSTTVVAQARPSRHRSRRGDLVAIPLLLLALLVFPFVAPGSIVGVGVYALIYALAALGLSLLMGLAGQVSLGQAGFFAIGAYTQAVLVTKYDVNALLASVCAVAVTMLAALLVGLPLLRLRGHYLALATLGFGIIVSVLAAESAFLGATSGIYGIPKPEANGRSYDSVTEYFLLLTPVVVLALLLARNIVESRLGRALGAVNDSEVAAESLGVNTFRLRVQVFVLAAAYASVAGTAFAHWIAVVNPNTANFPLSVKFLLMAVLGGLGTVYGAVVGAFAVEGLDEGLRRVIPELVPGAVGEVQLIGFGIALTAIMIFLPGGLHQAFRALVGKLSRRPAAGADGGAEEGADAAVPHEDDTPLLHRPGRRPDGTPLLEVAGLTKKFGGVVAVDSLDLTVHAGEIVALIGPNGAGKTTAFNMITGAILPSSGTVTMAGKRVEGRKPHVIAEAGATRTFQNLQIFGSSTVLGNVMVGRHLRSRAGLLRAALVLPARAEEREVEQSSRQLLEMLGLDGDAGRLAADLPFGRQRLVEIARALALEPDVLLLDEPMAGLSGAERRDLARLLRRLRAGGMAIVLVEHDVEAVLALADRVAVLEDGVRIALGTPDQVRHDPAVVAAYLGVDPQDAAAVELADADPTGAAP
jgi:branched-chain amino acid transport system permease protein